MVLVTKMQDIIKKKPKVDPNHHRPRSLNRIVRRNDLLRIHNENERIFKRLVRPKPTFHHEYWEEEQARNASLLKNISKYPPPVRHKKTRADRNLQPLNPSDERNSDAVLRQTFENRRNNRKGPYQSKRIFNQMIVIHEQPTHLRVFEKTNPAIRNATPILEIKAYVPSSDLEYLLSCQLDELETCFPVEDAKLFKPPMRRSLIQRLISHLAFATSSADPDAMELCLDLEPLQQKPDEVSSQTKNQTTSGKEKEKEKEPEASAAKAKPTTAAPSTSSTEKTAEKTTEKTV